MEVHLQSGTMQLDDRCTKYIHAHEVFLMFLSSYFRVFRAFCVTI